MSRRTIQCQATNINQDWSEIVARILTPLFTNAHQQEWINIQGFKLYTLPCEVLNPQDKTTLGSLTWLQIMVIQHFTWLHVSYNANKNNCWNKWWIQRQFSQSLAKLWPLILSSWDCWKVLGQPKWAPFPHKQTVLPADCDVITKAP